MLTVRGLSLFSKDRVIYHNVSFEVAPGSRFQVIGPNGSGKTVLLKTVLELAVPSSGTVRNSFASTGFLIEKPSFYPNFTVEQNLAISALYYPSKVELDTVVQDFKLGDLLKKKARTLSLGQKQRLGLAKAFLGNPHLLVLDEPFSNLDQSFKHTFADYLQQYLHANSHAAVVFASHESVPNFSPTSQLVLDERG